MRLEQRIPLSSPDITDREVTLVNQVLQTPCLSIGPMLERFERDMAAFIGRRFAVGVSNGTSGLHLCIRAAGVRPGDEVITSPFSFIASSNCILFEGAAPVFADVDPRTLNIDPDKIEEKITSRTRAILPVHIFGYPCDMDKIILIARRHGLAVIEDACEAIGSEVDGRKVGSFGDNAVFAFYPNKQMTTGEGGIIVTDDEEQLELFRSLRNQGRDESGAWLHHVRLGYNYRLNEISSALGVAQLERIDEILEKRQRVASWYDERLSSLTSVSVPVISRRVTRMSWFVYVVRLAPDFGRDRVMAELDNYGIPARPYFAPIHLQPFYVEKFGYRPGDFPVAEEASNRTLALPFYSNLEEDKVDFVCRTLQKIIEG